ncbi:MAG: hypothetical protein [Microviridae sp.]|nr:MAG: hypothetical protein [Microviridae sp.]
MQQSTSAPPNKPIAVPPPSPEHYEEALFSMEIYLALVYHSTPEHVPNRWQILTPYLKLNTMPVWKLIYQYEEIFNHDVNQPQ